MPAAEKTVRSPFRPQPHRRCFGQVAGARSGNVLMRVDCAFHDPLESLTGRQRLRGPEDRRDQFDHDYHLVLEKAGTVIADLAVFLTTYELFSIVSSRF